MQQDGEETKGLAKRAIAKGLDVTRGRRMSRLCGSQEWRAGQRAMMA
jgi:hypothetical protein